MAYYIKVVVLTHLNKIGLQNIKIIDLLEKNSSHNALNKCSKIFCLVEFLLLLILSIAYLGIEMTFFSKGLFLNQHKYIVDLLKDDDMLYTKLVATPPDNKLKLDSSSEHFGSFSHYQKLIGKLI